MVEDVARRVDVPKPLRRQHQRDVVRGGGGGGARGSSRRRRERDERRKHPLPKVGGGDLVCVEDRDEVVGPDLAPGGVDHPEGVVEVGGLAVELVRGLGAVGDVPDRGGGPSASASLRLGEPGDPGRLGGVVAVVEEPHGLSDLAAALALPQARQRRGVRGPDGLRDDLERLGVARDEHVEHKGRQLRDARGRERAERGRGQGAAGGEEAEDGDGEGPEHLDREGEAGVPWG